MSLQMTLALNVSPHSEARRCQSDAFLMRYALPEYKRDRTLPVSAGKSLWIFYISSQISFMMLCFALLRWRFGQAACCLASLNPLRPVIYAGATTAQPHRASCHQVAGQQNVTKLFDAACNHTRQRIWCGRKQQPTHQCGGQPQTSSYRGFGEDASLLLHQRVTE